MNLSLALLLWQKVFNIKTIHMHKNKLGKYSLVSVGLWNYKLACSISFLLLQNFKPKKW